MLRTIFVISSKSIHPFPSTSYMLQRADVGDCHYAKMFSVRLKLLVEVVMVKEGTVAADIGGHGCI